MGFSYYVDRYFFNLNGDTTMATFKLDGTKLIIEVDVTNAKLSKSGKMKLFDVVGWRDATDVVLDGKEIKVNMQVGVFTD